MRYAIFIVMFMAIYAGILFVVVPPEGSGAFAVGTIIGGALVPIILGCFGLFNRKNRFKGYVIATLIFGILSLVGAIT